MGIEFNIDSIKTERRPEGNSIINASTTDSNGKIRMQITIKNSELSNRTLIRELLQECVNSCDSAMAKRPIKTGDKI